MFGKWTKTIFGVGFALLFCFLCVGYAALNDELSITGTASAEGMSFVFNPDFAAKYLEGTLSIFEQEYNKAYNAYLEMGLSEEEADTRASEDVYRILEEQGLLDSLGILEQLIGTQIIRVGRSTDENLARVAALENCTSLPADTNGSGGIMCHVGYNPENQNNEAHFLLNPMAPENARIIFQNTSDFNSLCTLGLFLWEIHFEPDSVNVSAVTNISFDGFDALYTVDLRGLTDLNLTSAERMFAKCDRLHTVLFPNDFGNGVSSMAEMFYGCFALDTVDLSLLNTSSCTDMSGMFAGCTSFITLDLSGFDTSKVTNMANMFDMTYYDNSPSVLTTIYVTDSFVTTAVTNSTDMFANCTNLVGGKYTKYDPNYIDSEYACVDGGPYSETPGYFTKKHGPPPPPIVSNQLTNIYISSKAQYDEYYVDLLANFEQEYPDEYAAMQAEMDALIKNDGVKDDWFTTQNEPRHAELHNIRYRYLNPRYPATPLPPPTWIIMEQEANRWVTKIEFVKDTDISDNSWSRAKLPFDNFGSGGVQVYYKDSMVEWNSIDLYFVANTSLGFNKIVFSEISGFFQRFPNLKTIVFNDVLDTSRIKDFSNMFAGCSKLEKIIVGQESWNVNGATGDGMFTNCSNLVGGNGTKYDPNHTGIDYARVDVEGAPGYFTGTGGAVFATPPAAEVALDAEWALDMSISAQLDEDALRLTITPDEGYLLPESVNLAFGETGYTVYTTEGKRGENPAGIGFDPADNTITVAAALLPGGSFNLTVTGEAVPMPEPTPEPTPEATPEPTPEPPPTPTPTPAATANVTMDVTRAENMTVQLADDGIDNTLCLRFTAAEGYVLPESFTVSFGGKDYVIHTTEEKSADNPELMGYDRLTNILTIHGSMLPTEDFVLTVVGAAVPMATPEPTPEVTPSPSPDPNAVATAQEPEPTAEPEPTEEPEPVPSENKVDPLS